MTLPASGPISLSAVQTEFGGSNPVSLSEYYKGGAYVSDNNAGIPASGAISLSQLHGGVKQFKLLISANRSTPTDLRALAISSGWNGTDYLLIEVAGGVVLSSNTTGSYGGYILGSFPNGVKLLNRGIITGHGGAGGNIEAPGGAGGPGFYTSAAISIENLGILCGGGGGGGAGQFFSWSGLNRSTPGSAGGGGLTQSPGGGGGPATQGNPNVWGGTIYHIPGASANWGYGGKVSSPGGKGGDLGLAGDNGGGPDGAYNYSGSAGGAAGFSVTGLQYITWIGASGDIRGPTRNS